MGEERGRVPRRHEESGVAVRELIAVLIVVGSASIGVWLAWWLSKKLDGF